MQYANGDKEFINEFFERTLKIIEHYEQFNLIPEDKYDATLFCNCLVGILIFPEQEYFTKINDNLLSAKSLELLKKCVVKTNRRKNLKDIFKRMRNAVAHAHVKFPKSNYKTDTTIKSICFYDDGNYKSEKNLEDYEFKVEIQITDLKDILIEFCSNAIKKGSDTK